MAKLKERIILNSNGTKEVVRMNGNVIEQIKTEDGWKSYDEVRHPKTKEVEKPTNTTIDNTIINTTSKTESDNKTENDNKIDLGDNNSSNRFVIMNTTGGNIENKGKTNIIRVTPLTNKENNPQQSKQINKSSNKNNTKSVNKIVTKKVDNNNKQINVNKPVKNKVLEQRNEILKKDNITDNTNTTLNKSTKVNTSTKTNVSRNKPVSKTNINTASANKDNNKGFDWSRGIKAAIDNYAESLNSYKPLPYKKNNITKPKQFNAKEVKGKTNRGSYTFEYKGDGKVTVTNSVTGNSWRENIRDNSTVKTENSIMNRAKPVIKVTRKPVIKNTSNPANNTTSEFNLADYIGDDAASILRTFANDPGKAVIKH